MRTNQTSVESFESRDKRASIKELLSRPVSEQTLRRSRLGVGVLAAAGGAAVLFGWGNSAEAAATHNIKKGETLSELSVKHGISVKELAKANGIKPTDTIYAGKSLTIPAAGTVRERSSAAVSKGTYTVKSGDTLSSIASRHGVSVSALASVNNLSLKKILPIGKTLTIPAPTSTSPTASSAPRVAGSKSKSGNTPADMSPNDPRHKLRPLFAQAASQYGVPRSLLEAMTWNESGWQNGVTSKVGARGIGQIMPGTAQHINEMNGTKLNVNNTSDNIKMSAMYLRYLLNETRGDYKMALAAYYQGLSSVRSGPLYSDTKQYIATITALQKNYFG